MGEKTHEQNEATPLLASTKTSSSIVSAIKLPCPLVKATSDPVRLVRHMGLLASVLVIIGNVIGSGIFISPVGVLEASGSAGAALVIWLTVGLYCLVQALCYAELGTIIPKAGGDYAYIYSILGPLPAFLCVWVHVALICTTTVAAIARTAAVYTLLPFGRGCNNTAAVTLLAMLMIMTPAIVNVISTVWGTWLAKFLSYVKCLPLITIIIAGIVLMIIDGTVPENFSPPFAGTTTNPGLFAVAVLEGYFAFKGWELVCTLPEEMIHPERDLVRAITIAMLLITFIYFFTNVAFFGVLTREELFASEAVALTFAAKLHPVAPWFMSVFVALSCIGSINGSYLTDTRYLFAAGRNKQVPAVFSMLNIHFLTPVPAIISLCIIACCYTLIPTVTTLVEYASLGVQLKIMLAIIALLYLRWTSPAIHRPVKIPTVIVLFTLLLLLLLVGFSFYESPITAAVGCLLFLVGLPIYYAAQFIAKRQCSQTAVYHVTVFLQSLLSVVPET